MRRGKWPAIIIGGLILASGWLQPSRAQELKTAGIYRDLGGGVVEHEVKKGERLPAIAQRYAVRWRVLAKQNPEVNPDRLKPGTKLKIDHTFIIPAELTDGLVINLPELTLYHFQDGALVRRYALAAGKSDWQTPTGDYKILNKIKNPTWVVPPSIQEEMEELGQPVLVRVPPGPNNPLGAFWMATSAPGVGIHATTRPWSIGHFASHGCIRMLPDEIEELFSRVSVGTPVKIIYKPVKLALRPDGRIFLEVHRDPYRKAPPAAEVVAELLRRQQLEGLVAEELVRAAVKDRDGVALDITRPTPAGQLAERLYQGEIQAPGVSRSQQPARGPEAVKSRANPDS